MSPIDSLTKTIFPGSEVSVRVSTRSLWMDAVWHLDGVRPGGIRSDFSLDWGFPLADEFHFTDPCFAHWCEAAKTLPVELEGRSFARVDCCPRCDACPPI